MEHSALGGRGKRSAVQGHLQLTREFKASIGYYKLPAGEGAVEKEKKTKTKTSQEY